jgi:hypothetical protein
MIPNCGALRRAEIEMSTLVRQISITQLQIWSGEYQTNAFLMHFLEAEVPVPGRLVRQVVGRVRRTSQPICTISYHHLS